MLQSQCWAELLHTLLLLTSCSRAGPTSTAQAWVRAKAPVLTKQDLSVQSSTGPGGIPWCQQTKCPHIISSSVVVLWLLLWTCTTKCLCCAGIPVVQNGKLLRWKFLGLKWKTILNAKLNSVRGQRSKFYLFNVSDPNIFVAWICQSKVLQFSDKSLPFVMCTSLQGERSVKIYTESCHLCKVFHQSPGCSAMCLTAMLCKLKESEGKEQLW